MPCDMRNKIFLLQWQNLLGKINGACQSVRRNAWICVFIYVCTEAKCGCSGVGVQHKAGTHAAFLQNANTYQHLAAMTYPTLQG